MENDLVQSKNTSGVSDMKITNIEIEHLAGLSKIYLDQTQVGQYAESIDKIINYVNKLSEVESGSIEPTDYILPLYNIFRDDVIENSADQDDILRNAADCQDGCFHVPQVVELL